MGIKGGELNIAWWVSGPKHRPAGRDQKVVVANSERQSGGFEQPVK